MATKAEPKLRVVAANRKARFNYFIDETMEAGLALTGTEVKSLRAGKATIAESYADARGGDVGVKLLAQRVVAGNHMLFAAFLAQAQLPAGAARPQILDPHLEGSADAGETISQRGDQRAVAPLAHCVSWNRI